jgi:hypothetical protein
MAERNLFAGLANYPNRADKAVSGLYRYKKSQTPAPRFHHDQNSQYNKI